jgi:hypothetical protein
MAKRPTYMGMSNLHSLSDLHDRKKVPWWKPTSCCIVLLGFEDKYASSDPLVLNPATSHISPQFHIIIDDLFSTVISQLESDEPPKEWNDLCITSCYQTNFNDNNPTRLDDEWLTMDVLTLQRHQVVKTRLFPHSRLLILHQTHQVYQLWNLISHSWPYQLHWNIRESNHSFRGSYHSFQREQL